MENNNEERVFPKRPTDLSSRLHTRLDPTKRPLLPPRKPLNTTSSKPPTPTGKPLPPTGKPPTPTGKPPTPTGKPPTPTGKPSTPARPIIKNFNQAISKVEPNENVILHNKFKHISRQYDNPEKEQPKQRNNGLTPSYAGNLSKLKSVSAPDISQCGVYNRPTAKSFLDEETIYEDEGEDAADGQNKKKQPKVNLNPTRLRDAAKTGVKKGIRKWQSFAVHRHNDDSSSSSQRTFSPNERYSELHLDSDSELFDYVIVVSLKEISGNLTPYITFQFPPKFEEYRNTLLESIPQFCFPDISSSGFNHGVTFSFVLTNDTGVRSYGFCRMIQTAKMEQPEVFCIISPLGLFALYAQILEEVQYQRQYSSTAVFSFLKTILSKPLPQPTESLDVSFFSSGSNGGMRKVSLTRPGDSAIHEHVELQLFFEKLQSEKILHLLTCLLTENKVVLCSKSLSFLSTSCHTLISLLYPFEWDHTFIPVLPTKLVDVLCLPTPYLLGILPSVLPELEDLPIDDVTVIDLDTGSWVRKPDIPCSLPKQLCNQVVLSLKHVIDLSLNQSGDLVDGEEKAQNEIITEIFLQMYLQLMGHFESFYTAIEGIHVINYKPFYKASKTKEQKQFLKVFTPTQAFQKFATTRKTAGPSHGLFENRLSALKISKSNDNAGHFKKNVDNMLSNFKKRFGK